MNGFGDAIKPLIILDNNRKPFYEADPAWCSHRW